MAVSRDSSVGAPPQVFVKENDEPVSFYIFGSRADDDRKHSLSDDRRDELAHAITQHGGMLSDSEDKAETVIVAERSVSQFDAKYKTLRNRYAEGPTFVPSCIRNLRYAHKPTVQKPMGGRIPGAKRTSFTAEDTYNLCKYLAHTIPDPTAGGRLGDNVYKELMDSAVNPERQWVQNHTYQSWKEHYKKNREKFDRRIARMVERSPPPVDGKGLFPYSRHANKQPYIPWDGTQDREEDEAGKDEAGKDEAEEEGYNEFSPNVQARHGVARRHEEEGYNEFSPRAQASDSVEPHSRRGRSPSVGSSRNEFESHVEFYNASVERSGSQDAGPSGTQRTPSPPPVRSASRQSRRLFTPVAFTDFPAAKSRTQVPMSSQATLVGPVPTQLQNAVASQKQTPAVPVAKAKRRRINIQPTSAVVPIGSLPALGPRARAQKREEPQAVGQGKGKARAVERHEGEESDGGVEEQSTGQSNDDEMNVEEMLGSDAGRDQRLSPEIPYEPSVRLDSDDERARQKLLLRQGPPPSSASAPVSARASSKRPSVVLVDDDDEMYAEGLNLTGTPVRASAIPPSIQLSSFPAQLPATPRIQRSTSNESAIPIPGTRASAEKRRARLEARYEPPMGTRAAEVASAERLRLRNRTVSRR